MKEFVKRKSLRLPEYDYSQAGYYFVTICTENKKCLFGKVENGKMILNQFGKIVDEEWKKTLEIRKNVLLDAFIIMPNHVHGIIIAGDQPVGVCRRQTRAGRGLKPQSFGSIVNHIKSVCTKRIRSYCVNNFKKNPSEIWQRNYFEHIIRNEKSLLEIRNYILNNPLKWELDSENPARKNEKQGLPAANPYNVVAI